MNSSELQSLFSKNLKNARNRAKLSQMKLAEKANLSVGYICDLESGRRWGTPETFAKLAAALDINPFELLLPSPSDAQESEDLNKRREILAAFSQSLRENISSAVDKAITETLEKN